LHQAEIDGSGANRARVAAHQPLDLAADVIPHHLIFNHIETLPQRREQVSGIFGIQEPQRDEAAGALRRQQTPDTGINYSNTGKRAAYAIQRRREPWASLTQHLLDYLVRYLRPIFEIRFESSFHDSLRP
jgi:hypothetical protein